MGGDGEGTTEIFADTIENGELVLYPTHWKARKHRSGCDRSKDVH